MGYLAFGFVLAMCLYGTGQIQVRNRAEWLLTMGLCAGVTVMVGLAMLVRASPLLAGAAVFGLALSVHSSLKAMGVFK